MPSSDQHPPRYQRAVESAPQTPPEREIIPPSGHESAIAASDLSGGSRAVLRGLMRLGRMATFRGGGVGLDYAGLLKSAVRPDIMSEHVTEVAGMLREHRVDLLLVPGMSGFPIGTMYAAAAGIPALLLRKEPWRGDRIERTLPPGAFVLPSYTSSGEVVMTADPFALLDISAPVFQRQAEEQGGAETVRLTLRVAGADDIIDKATMARAVSDSAQHLGRYAAASFQRDWYARTGDSRPVEISVTVVTWVTPLVKQYNRPDQQLAGMLEAAPMAGVWITGIYTAPRAIGVDGVGVLAFDEPVERSG